MTLRRDLLGRSTNQPSSFAAETAALPTDPGAIARAAITAASGAEAALLDIISRLVCHDEGGLDGNFVAVVACLRLLPDHAGPRAALPLARALDIAAAATQGLTRRQRSAATTTLDADGLKAALNHVADPAKAEAAIAAAAAGEVETPRLAAAVTDLLYQAPDRRAHLAPLVVAALEVARVAGRDVSVETLARLARTLVLKQLPEREADRALIAPISTAFERLYAAQDAAKSAAFQEARFRPHLLRARPESLIRALGKAVAFGVPRTHIASSLCLAAAERLLQFDPGVDRSARRPETWLDAAWLLQVCEAIRALGVLQARPAWLGLLLHGALWVRHADGICHDEPQPLPEPATLARTWDHGPEIARVTGAMLAGDGDRATRVLRGYLLMVLPEQPLSAAIVASALEDGAATAAEQGVLLATVSSAMAGFSATPDLAHRELLPAAALHLWTAPRRARPVFALVHREVDQAEGGTAPTAPAVLPWCGVSHGL